MVRVRAASGRRRPLAAAQQAELERFVDGIQVLVVQNCMDAACMDAVRRCEYGVLTTRDEDADGQETGGHRAGAAARVVAACGGVV